LGGKEEEKEGRRREEKGRRDRFWLLQ